ncbi:MAG: FHA domain-containing protein [Prevotella sp.]|nr:FHA domain-containing protein [Prevotella sp.]
MIICPRCKEDIEDDSHFCDQCGQALVYCSSCGRVGMGRRCTHCGALMISPDEYQEKLRAPKQPSVVEMSNAGLTLGSLRRSDDVQQTVMPKGVPTLTLYNPSLDIRMQGINGAVIGRRQGPYQKFFEGNMFVSGVHAQIIYKPDTGWCIVDKHSSNGTKLNQREVLPDVPMSIKSGDIVSLANINLQVSIS